MKRPLRKILPSKSSSNSVAQLYSASRMKLYDAFPEKIRDKIKYLNLEANVHDIHRAHQSYGQDVNSTLDYIKRNYE